MCIVGSVDFCKASESDDSVEYVGAGVYGEFAFLGGVCMSSILTGLTTTPKDKNINC